jgi:hypothetical protein
MMTRSRRGTFHPPILSPVGFVLALHLVLAGCAAGQASVQKGESGPIAWEVTDIRQSLQEQGNRMRWDYTLVLRNISSKAITFDQITLVATAPRGDITGGHTSRPYSRTLDPGVEVRDTNHSYNHGCIRNCDPQIVQEMFRNGVMRVIELRGRDAAGTPVTAIIRIRLDSSVGKRPSPVLTSGRPTPIRELGQIAGKWRGTIFGSGSPPAQITIESDGRYSWRGDRESGAGTLRVADDGRARFESSAGRRGSLTLYESEGRRRLTVDYEGVDWKGELTPTE